MVLTPLARIGVKMYLLVYTQYAGESAQGRGLYDEQIKEYNCAEDAYSEILDEELRNIARPEYQRSCDYKVYQAKIHENKELQQQVDQAVNQRISELDASAEEKIRIAAAKKKQAEINQLAVLRAKYPDK